MNKKIVKMLASSLIVFTTMVPHQIFAENVYSVAIKNEVVTRDWAGEDSTIRNTFSKDTVFNVYDTSGDFLFITNEMNYGWVHKKDVLARDERGNQVSYGKNTASNLNVRDNPSLDGQVTHQLQPNDEVIITNISEDYKWFYIKNDLGEGWVFSEYIQVENQIQSAKIIYNQPLTDEEIMNNDQVEINRSADRQSNYQIPMGQEETTVEIHDYKEGLYYIKDQDGQFQWISSKNVTIESIIEDKKSNKAEEIMTIAKGLLGKPYVWGASGPNAFDCSGFTKYVFAQVGITLTRTSKSQSTEGQWVGLSELQEGDLVFFDTSGPINNTISHVGIYIGNNQFIHASSGSSGRRVIISNLYSEYYGRRIVTTRRII
ncbi:MAG: NlpC/P60 family protein [Peptostreptococcales bacterium]